MCTLSMKTCQGIAMMETYNISFDMIVNWVVTRIQTDGGYVKITVCVCGTTTCNHGPIDKPKPTRCFPPVYINWNGDTKEISDDIYAFLKVTNVICEGGRLNWKGYDGGWPILQPYSFTAYVGVDEN